jgi:ATP-dependent Clp protease ATP-binding subunit ClpA
MTAGSHRYSHHALRALAHATTLATGFQHPYQDTGHMLVGVMLAEGSVGAQVMIDLDLTPEFVAVFLKRMMPYVENVPEPMVRAEAFDKALEDALLESDWLGTHYIGTEHLLLGITRTNQGNAGELLRLLDIQPEQIRRRVKNLIQSRETEFNLTAARANIRLSELSRRVLNAAEQTALSLEHSTVGIGHLMLALVQERRGVTSDILQRSGLNQPRLNAGLHKRLPALLTGLETVLTNAIEQADKLGSHYVGADHLLLTLTLVQPGIVLLQQYGAEVDRINRLLNKHLRVEDKRDTQESG